MSRFWWLRIHSPSASAAQQPGSAPIVAVHALALTEKKRLTPRLIQQLPLYSDKLSQRSTVGKILNLLAGSHVPCFA